MAAPAVTFPAGSTHERSVVAHVAPVPAGLAIVARATPFHPVDHRWPDQPSDRGRLDLLDRSVEIPLAETAALDPSGELYVGSDIPVARGADGWTFMVAHVVAADEGVVKVGDEVGLEVDAAYRRSLSAAHTACHLTALALNRVTEGLWRKEPPARDSTGHPNLDKVAISSSRISTTGSVDVYRLGKSLRKKGFMVADAASRWPALAAEAEALVNAWAATGAPVRLQVESAVLDAVRLWQCQLPDGEASIPCGGTHVASLAELGGVAVAADLDAGGTELTITTTVGAPAE